MKATSGFFFWLGLLFLDKLCTPSKMHFLVRPKACLPIYLASCSKMVVICGETYLTRPDLWNWMLWMLEKHCTHPILRISKDIKMVLCLKKWWVVTCCDHSPWRFARLWCVIELFVFLEMGGSLENLEAQLQILVEFGAIFHCSDDSDVLISMQPLQPRRWSSCLIRRIE